MTPARQKLSLPARTARQSSGRQSLTYPNNCGLPCQCSCGALVVVRKGSLTGGTSKRCGKCARKQTLVRHWTHGPRPSTKHSIDRYPNPFGDYEPGNVRWATASEQARNQRRFHPCGQSLPTQEQAS